MEDWLSEMYASQRRPGTLLSKEGRRCKTARLGERLVLENTANQAQPISLEGDVSSCDNSNRH